MDLIRIYDLYRLVIAFIASCGIVSLSAQPSGWPVQANSAAHKTPQQGDLKTFWLIPRDPVSCLMSDRSEVIYVDKDKVSVQDCNTGSRTLQFPGCTKLRAEIQLLQDLTTNLFANIQFQWQSLPQANNLKCEKSESNGCGGVGNNCYYCDICKSIVSIQNDPRLRIQQQDQFQCPTKPKIYKMEKTLDVKDWHGLDENNNGVIDFLEDGNFQNIRDYLKSIDATGFGTLVINFQLATNATSAQQQQKASEELRIRNDVARKYASGQKSADEIQAEQDSEVSYWHRNSYLPWLIKVNQVGCVNFIFDICLNQPQATNVQSSYQCA